MKGTLLIAALLIASSAVSASAPKVIILANSIDYTMASEFLESLKSKFEVQRITAQEFEKYKTEKFIVILGGHRAYDGVGEVVSQILLPEEQLSLMRANNFAMHVKTNLWAKKQVVVILAGSTRHQTKQAHTEHRQNTIENLKETPEKIFTSLEVVSNVTVKEGETAVLKAVLKDENGKPVAGKNISFHLGKLGEMGSSLTDETGTATISYSEAKFWGSHEFTAFLREDSTHTQSMGRGTLTIIPTKIFTSIIVSPFEISAESGTNITIAAKLFEMPVDFKEKPKPLAGKTLIFSVGEMFAGSAVTGDSGEASVIYAVPTNWLSGYREVKVAFLGDSEYASSQGTGRLLITSQLARQVKINEVELNSPGDDASVGQWIELYNPASFEIDLTGWKIGAKGLEKLFKGGVLIKLPVSGKLPPKGYLTVTLYKGAFLNHNETISLFDSMGNEVDKTPELSDDKDDDMCWAMYPEGRGDWRFQKCTKEAAN